MGDVHSPAAEQLGELGLGPHLPVREEVGDELLTGVLGGGSGVSAWSAHASLLLQPGQDRLLGVPAVLGLVPHDALRAVDHLGGDLRAPVGRQAVQHDRVGLGAGEQLGGDARTARRSPAGPSASSSLPIDTQVSVTTTSAPRDRGDRVG